MRERGCGKRGEGKAQYLCTAIRDDLASTHPFGMIIHRGSFQISASNNVVGISNPRAANLELMPTCIFIKEPPCFFLIPSLHLTEHHGTPSHIMLAFPFPNSHSCLPSRSLKSLHRRPHQIQYSHIPAKLRRLPSLYSAAHEIYFFLSPPLELSAFLALAVESGQSVALLPCIHVAAWEGQGTQDFGRKGCKCQIVGIERRVWWKREEGKGGIPSCFALMIAACASFVRANSVPDCCYPQASARLLQRRYAPFPRYPTGGSGQAPELLCAA